MTPENGQPIVPAHICWEQREQEVGFGDHPIDGKGLKYVGYLSSEQCEQILKVTYCPDLPARWPGSDWKYNPGIRWVAPNGTQWLCGSNLWPWLPVSWVGCCTLGFAFAHGSIKPSLQQALVNLPYLHAWWARSVMIKIKALTNFTKQALLDNAKAIQDNENGNDSKSDGFRLTYSHPRRDLCYN